MRYMMLIYSTEVDMTTAPSDELERSLPLMGPFWRRRRSGASSLRQIHCREPARLRRCAIEMERSSHSTVPLRKPRSNSPVTTSSIAPTSMRRSPGPPEFRRPALEAAVVWRSGHFGKAQGRAGAGQEDVAAVHG